MFNASILRPFDGKNRSAISRFYDNCIEKGDQFSLVA